MENTIHLAILGVFRIVENTECFTLGDELHLAFCILRSSLKSYGRQKNRIRSTFPSDFFFPRYLQNYIFQWQFSSTSGGPRILTADLRLSAIHLAPPVNQCNRAIQFFRGFNGQREYLLDCLLLLGQPHPTLLCSHMHPLKAQQDSCLLLQILVRKFHSFAGGRHVGRCAMPCCVTWGKNRMAAQVNGKQTVNIL